MSDRTVSVKLRADVAQFIAGMNASAAASARAEAAAKTAQRAASTPLGGAGGGTANNARAEAASRALQRENQLTAAERASGKAAAQAGLARQRAAEAAAKAQSEAETAARRAALAEQQAMAKRNAGARQLSHSLALVGLATAAVAAVSVTKFAEFDQAMSHVAAATHESAHNMSLLRAAALEAGARTVFTAKESANAMEELAKAGLSTADILSGGLNAALNLASAGGIRVADAAEQMASTMVQFGLHGKDAAHIADVLAAGAGKAQGSVTDMALALSYVGPQAAQMGISLEETVGTLALLSNNGILAEKAGTGMRGALLSLASPSRRASEEMQALGLHVYDSSGKFIGMAGAAEELNRGFAKLTPAQRDYAMGIIFSNAQTSAANILTKSGAAAVDEWTNKVNHQNYASVTASIRLNNLRGDVEKLGGALDTAFITSGSGANGPLRGLVEDVTGLVNAYNKLPTSVQQGTVTVSALAAAMALSGAAALAVIPKYAATRVALADMGVTATSTRAAMAGLAGSVAVLAAASGADIVGGMLGRHQADKADVDALAASLRDTAKAGELGAAGLHLFDSGWGPFTNHATDTREALHRFSVEADVAFGDNMGNRIARMQEFGAQSSALREQTSKLDQALAQLANGGHQAEAQEWFHKLSEASGLTGDKLVKLQALFPLYIAAVSGVDTATGGAASAQGRLGDAAQDATSQLEKQKSAGDQLKESLDALNGGTTSVARAHIALNDSISAVKKSFKENGKAIDENHDKGRANLSAILDYIDRSNALSQAVADQTGSVEKGRQAFAAQIPVLRKVLAEQGLLPKQIDHLVAAYAKVPDHVVTTAELATIQAEAKTKALIAALAKIPSQRTVMIALELTGSSNLTEVRRALAKQSAPERHADGGFITGPGGPTDDQVPALLSNGEFVVNAAATARNRSLLEQLNAQRFAAGGHVTAKGPTAAQVKAAAKSDAASRQSAAAAAAATTTADRVTAIADDSFKSTAAAAAAVALIEKIAAAYQRLGQMAGQSAADRKKFLAEERIAAAQATAAQKLTLDENRDEWKFDHLSTADQIKNLTKRLAATKKYSGEWMQLAQQREQLQQQQADEAKTAAATLVANKASFEFDHSSSSQQLADLDKRIGKEKEFSDTWMQLTSQREQVQSQVDADRQQAQDDLDRAAQDATSKYGDALSHVNDLLDQRASLMQQLGQAQSTFTQAVAAANTQLAEQTSQLKSQRVEALASWSALTEKPVVQAAASVASLIRNAQGSIDQFTEWQSQLDLARQRGVSQDVIDALGLDASPVALGQLRKLNQGTAEQVAQLNALTGARRSLASGQTDAEAGNAATALGRDIAGAQDTASRAISDAHTTLLASTQDLTGQIASLGVDQGRSYVDAITQGMNAGTPGLTAAVAALRDSFGGMSAAQAAAGHATGGLIVGPGSGTSDSITARLSNGEFVVNAEATARHRSLLEAVNTNRFSAGGYVSAARIPASTTVHVDAFGTEMGLRRVVERLDEQTQVMRRGQTAQAVVALAGW